MKTTFSILLVLLLYYKSYCQATRDANLLFIEILNDSLEFNSVKDTSRTITLKFKNGSNTNLLAYGLGISSNLRGVPFESSQLCELEGVSSGLAMILYNNAGKEVSSIVEISDPINTKPMTQQRLDSMRQQLNSMRRNANEQFINNVILFKKSSGRTFNKKVNLCDYPIKKGVYSMQVMFYCGRKITFVNDEKKIARDCKKLNARLYQGCTRSNKIILIVK